MYELHLTSKYTRGGKGLLTWSNDDEGGGWFEKELL